MFKNAIKKIVITGPESTGKSELCKQLAIHYNTIYVPEMARNYLEQIATNYTENDLLEIAKLQIAEEEKLLHQANKFLFCDTDLYVIKIWSEIKFGKCNKYILDEIAKREYYLYLLMDIDLPWQYDVLRESPDILEREKILKMHIDILQNNTIPFYKITGKNMERKNNAINAIKINF